MSLNQTSDKMLQPKLVAKPVQRLNPLVSERIAAGEVVERPASCVKELVENSLDAGATKIQVHLEGGGKSLIQVTDNGHGMTPADLTLAIERHATSKIQNFEDLESLSTLGFRGEALPSLIACADLEIISKTAVENSAHSLKTSSGQILSSVHAVTIGDFLGFSHGTQISVFSLFSQIPARLKFLKSDAGETSAIRDWIERLSLCYPNVEFQLTHESKTILNLKAASLEQRAKSILGDDNGLKIVSFHRKAPLEISAYWLSGYGISQTKKLVQIVNQRPVKDRFIQSAILSAFSQSMMPGQFPALVLKIQIPSSEVDVNVHPSKTEIRFQNPNFIFKEIRSTLDQMILENGNAVSLPWVARGMEKGTVSSGFSNNNSSDSRTSENAPTPQFQNQNTGLQSSFFTPFSEYQAAKENPQIQSADPHEKLTQAQNAGLFLPQNYIGTFFATYFAYQDGEELILIDQHAAHERIRYEKFKKRFLNQTSFPSQALLIPEALQFPEEQRALIEKSLPQLQTLGFECELFSENTLLFRAIPIEWSIYQKKADQTGLKSRLKMLVERLSDDLEKRNDLFWDHTLFEKMASEACRSSIKSGDYLKKEEIDFVVKELFETEHPWNCPHGRPTVVKVSKSRFDEWFLRI